MKNSNPDTQLALASGVGFKLSNKDRETILSCFAGLDQISEPLREKFLGVKTEVETVLASIPKEDEPVTPGADHATAIANLTKMYRGTQELMLACKNEAEIALKDKQTALAGIPAEVGKQIDAKVAAGELLTKESLATKIADAVSAARKAVLEEVKIVSDRRTQLASANLPIPADSELIGADADFKAKSDKAKERVTKLSEFGLPTERITQLAWAAPDAQFDATVSLLTAARAAAVAPPASGKSAGGNPFMAPAPAASAPKKQLGPL